MKKILSSDETMITAIFESTWSRVVGWMGLHDIATISAFRKELKDFHNVRNTNIPGGMEIGDEFSLRINSQRTSRLRAELIARGYGVTYIDDNSIEVSCVEDLKDVGRKSIFVVNINNKPNFYSELFKLGERYNQDGFLYKPCCDEHAYFIGTNDADFPGYGNSANQGQLTSLSSKFMLRIRNACFAYVNKDMWTHDKERQELAMREKNRVRMESIRKWEAAKNMDENMYCSFRKKLKDATLSVEERKMYEELVRKRMLISAFPDKEAFADSEFDWYRRYCVKSSVEDEIMCIRAMDWELLIRNNGVKLETKDDIKGFSRQLFMSFLK